MCQMCDEYDAELRRMGIEPQPRDRDKQHAGATAPAPDQSAEDRQRQPSRPASGSRSADQR